MLIDACSPNIRIDCYSKLDSEIELSHYLDCIGVFLGVIHLTSLFQSVSTDFLIQI